MSKTLNKINIIDLEATCWENKIPPEGMFNDIIEIGICVLDLQTLEKVEKRSIIVKPTSSTISTFCTELTSITQEMVDREGVTFAEAILILIKEFKTKERVWASWGDYDRVQFEKQCNREGIDYPFKQTHINAKTMFALRHKHKKEMGMARALEFIKKPLEGTHHRGVDDAWNIADLFAELIR